MTYEYMTLEGLYWKEYEGIRRFCNNTGFNCFYENDRVYIISFGETWFLHQSIVDDTILLYHKNTRVKKFTEHKCYEKYDGYHIQNWYFDNIWNTLCYTYLHYLTVSGAHMPKEELPVIIRDFINWQYERRRSPSASMSKKTKHRIHRKIQKAERKRESKRVIEILESLFPDKEETGGNLC